MYLTEVGNLTFTSRAPSDIITTFERNNSGFDRPIGQAHSNSSFLFWHVGIKHAACMNLTCEYHGWKWSNKDKIRHCSQLRPKKLELQKLRSLISLSQISIMLTKQNFKPCPNKFRFLTNKICLCDLYDQSWWTYLVIHIKLIW